MFAFYLKLEHKFPSHRNKKQRKCHEKVGFTGKTGAQVREKLENTAHAHTTHLFGVWYLAA